MSFLAPANDWLTAMLGPSGPLMAVGMLGVLMILIALPAFLTRKKDSFDRLHERMSSTDDVQAKVERLRRPEGKYKL